MKGAFVHVVSIVDTLYSDVTLRLDDSRTEERVQIINDMIREYRIVISTRVFVSCQDTRERAGDRVGG